MFTWQLFEFNLFVNMNIFFLPTSLAKRVIVSTKFLFYRIVGEKMTARNPRAEDLANLQAKEPQADEDELFKKQNSNSF